MKFITYVFLFALLLYNCRGDKTINQIYRLTKFQKNSNNYDLNNVNQIQSENMFIDMLFNIYSFDKDYNKAWIILLNFSINDISYIKNEDFNNKNYSNFLTLLKDKNYSLIPNYININDFEEPNFNLIEIFLNKENTKSKQLKYLFNFPFIKFTFSEKGILKIYKHNEISNFDFISLIQNINQIIFSNKNKLFKINSQTENQKNKENEFEYYDIENSINILYSIYQSKKLCPFKNNDYKYFSSSSNSSNYWKKYFEDQIKKQHFSITLFKKKLFTYKLIGTLKFDILNDKQSRIKFDINLYLFNKKYDIVSLNYTRNTTKIIKDVLNKIGEVGDQIEKTINKAINIYPEYNIPNKIKTILKILYQINIKSLFNEPVKTLLNLFVDNKDLALDYINYFAKDIINYVMENYKILKVFLEPFLTKMKELIYSSNKIFNFFSKKFGKFYLNITNNFTKNIYEKISTAYNSETAKNVISILNKSIKHSGEVLKNNTQKIINSSNNFFKGDDEKNKKEDEKNKKEDEKNKKEDEKNKKDEKNNSSFFNNVKNTITNTKDKIKDTTKNIKSKASNITKNIGNKIKNLFK